jgi:hypothetical protein
MHNERVWNINHGLVHHSLAAGPAARRTLSQHLPGQECKNVKRTKSISEIKQISRHSPLCVTHTAKHIESERKTCLDRNRLFWLFLLPISDLAPSLVFSFLLCWSYLALWQGLHRLLVKGFHSPRYQAQGVRYLAFFSLINAGNGYFFHHSRRGWLGLQRCHDVFNKLLVTLKKSLSCSDWHIHAVIIADLFLWNTNLMNGR